MKTIMVELYQGYGDGYAEVRVADDGQPAVNPARRVKTYSDGSRMERWRQEVLSSPSIDLVDKGVRVPIGAIKRVIGPLDCPEAVRVRANRYTKNWHDRAFVALASDADLAHAMSLPTEPEVYAAMSALRAACV
jgi:hypothetical protein